MSEQSLGSTLRGAVATSFQGYLTGPVAPKQGDAQLSLLDPK